MTLSASEQTVIRNVVQRLRAQRGGSGRVHDVLKGDALAPYLESWVISPLELLLKEDRDRTDLMLAVSLST